ncbi:MAG: RNase adapter RapZ [bacterium]
MGFYCIDNLPPTLISRFIELCNQAQGKLRRIALVIDIRGGDFFAHLFTALDELEAAGIEYSIIYLDASDETLVRRFKETRRRHPLAPRGLVAEGIKLERSRLEELKSRANHIIDTTDLSTAQLKGQIRGIFSTKHAQASLPVTILSFGFKYGLPLDPDLIFDVRFLPNPYYIESLRHLTGYDKEVQDYVLQWPATEEFLQRVVDLLTFLLPYYQKEGKTHLLVGIGCTGGKHRSSVIAQELARRLRQRQKLVQVEHRDIERSGVGEA